MRTRNKLIARGILSAIVLVFLTMQITPGIYAQKTSVSTVYKVYYGQLHSHTWDSDGRIPTIDDPRTSGTPYKAYAYARDEAHLDFFSVADHCSYPYGPNESLTDDKYNSLMETANTFNQDVQDDEEERFVTFWGFEWTSDDTSWGGPATLLGKGHITIINSPNFCKATGENTNDLNELVDWMSTRDCIAFFNHPGQYGYDFDKFLFNSSDKIVGMELWNRDDDYYDTNYYGNGSWNNALGKGWYIGASGSEDNHVDNWGTLTEWRMAVLAEEKTRESIYAAMKARRFYSCRDKDLELSFTCNRAQMGSQIAGGRLNVEIKASDPDEIFSKIWLFKNGKKIKNWNPNITNPTVTTTVNGTKGDYFYVLVEQAGEFKWAAISSPIFINKYK